jgi:hypothetical protein
MICATSHTDLSKIVVSKLCSDVPGVTVVFDCPDVSGTSPFAPTIIDVGATGTVFAEDRDDIMLDTIAVSVESVI